MKRERIIYPLMIATVFVFASCGLLSSTPDNSEEVITYEEILFFRFTAREAQLCAMRPTGEDRRVILSRDYMDGIPQVPYDYITAKWSPDKRYIALIGGPNNFAGYYPITLLSSNGTTIRELTSSSLNVIWYDNETIYYIKSAGTVYSQYNLYRMNIDDLNEELVYSQTDSTNISFAGFFDQTNWLATETIYSHDTSGTLTSSRGDIMSFNITSREKDYLIQDETRIESSPLLSPNKQRIVFRQYPSDDTGLPPHNLYWFDLPDGNPQQLTFFTDFNVYQNGFYAWGPNSDRIAVTNPDPMVLEWNSEESSYSDIYLINLQTGIVDTLTHGARDGSNSYVLDWR